MPSNPRQFHELSRDQQAALAANYVENMKVFDGANIPYTDKGMEKIIKMRNNNTFFYPHKGIWIMKFHTGKEVRSRGVRNLIQALREQL